MNFDQAHNLSRIFVRLQPLSLSSELICGCRSRHTVISSQVISSQKSFVQFSFFVRYFTNFQLTKNYTSDDKNLLYLHSAAEENGDGLGGGSLFITILLFFFTLEKLSFQAILS